VFVEPQKKSLFYFTFAMTPTTRLAQSAVYNTIEQYGIRFLVESDDTIPTNTKE